MKRILIIFILLFTLISCGKNSNESINVNNKNIENNNVQIINENNLDIEKKNKKKIEDANVFLERQEKYGNERMMNMNCEDFSELKEIYKECLSMKQKAKKDFLTKKEEVSKKVENFKISDCKKIINSKFVNILDDEKIGPKGETFKQIKENEIKYCEIGYALQKGCDLIENSDRQKYCKKLKEISKIKEKSKIEGIKKMQYELDIFKTFDLYNFLY